MKAHLLIFDEARIPHREMIEAVDRMPEIANWHAVFRNTISLASDLDAKVLATQLNRRFPHLRYLITEVQPERKGGRMNRSVLELLNAPGPVEAESA